jgi:hypothetical protein
MGKRRGSRGGEPLRVVFEGDETMTILGKPTGQPSSQIDVQDALHRTTPAVDLSLCGALGTGKAAGGGVTSNFTPKVFRTVSAFPIWQVGFPFSKSMMKRRPVPEVRASAFCVTPRLFLAVCTISPIFCGEYFIISNVSGMYYRAVTIHPKSLKLQIFITER